MTTEYSNYLTALALRDQQLGMIAVLALIYVLLWFALARLPIHIRNLAQATYLASALIVIFSMLIMGLLAGSA